MATHTRIDMFHDLGWLVGLAVLLVLPCISVRAQPAPSDTAQPPSVTLPPVDIIAPSPLLGSGVDRDTVPAETNVLKGNDLTRGGTLITPDVTRALNEQVGGVNLDSASGNPYQPTLFYHGFEASALQGTPQGLAVYVNGVRFNSAFGDTVNFDLIPDVAIDQMNLEGSNPVFGLNALGGALNVQLKNGFTYQGGEISFHGGSFGTYGGDFQYGKQSGNTSAYFAASGVSQEGWRDLQSTTIENFYGDVGWRGNAGELHLECHVRQLGAERAGDLAGGTAVRRPRCPVHRPQPDQQPLHAGEPDRQPGRQRYGVDPGRHLLQQSGAEGDQRQRCERHALQRRFGPAVHRSWPQHDAWGRPDPGVRRSKSVLLFGVGQPEHEHQRLRRLGPGDRYANGVRL